MENFQIKELNGNSVEVYLVSYPRSGNTWMRFLLAYLIHPEISWNINNLNRAIPDIYQQIPDNYIISHPSIVKSHSPYNKTYPKVIYLYRDGRDVSLSFYDLKSKVKGYDGSYIAFLRDMLQGNLRFGSWQEHVNSWLFNTHKIPFLPIKYEDLCSDSITTVKLVGEFLGFNWNTEQVLKALSQSTFEKQKKDFYRYKYKSHWSKGFKGGIKGSPGKWRDVYNSEQKQLFWQYAREICEKLGYSKD